MRRARDHRNATTDLDRPAAAPAGGRRQIAALLAERDRLLDRLVGRETVLTQRDHE